MPWTILENLWKRTSDFHKTYAFNENTTWNLELETLYKFGISMEDTIKYLYFEKPSFDSFKNWIKENQKEQLYDQGEFAEDVLSEEDIAFWEKNGYVVVKNAISIADCEETQQIIWDFLGMSPDDIASWYNRHEEQKGLMLAFSNHIILDKNRSSMRIQRAYEQLYKTKEIYKTIDKVSFNPPENKSFRFLGSPLHWDVSLKLPIPFGLQGLLYLTDCGPNDGAFHCVPGFHREIEPWLNMLLPDENPRVKAYETLKPIPVIGDAGDFIIWHQALPHCATPNRGMYPRMVQYLTYLPHNYMSSEEWI